jgi:hypothetical protein
VPQRFEATWSTKLAAAALAIPWFMIGVVVGTDGGVSLPWRTVYAVGAVIVLCGLWRWGHSYCLVGGDGVTVVGILRKRRFAAHEVIRVEVEPGGCLRWNSQVADP